MYFCVNTDKEIKEVSCLSFFTAIFFGLVSGITFFLPVSETGHMAVLSSLFKIDSSTGQYALFMAMLRISALVAIFLVYRKDVSAIVADTVDTLLGRDDMAAAARGGRLRPNVRLLVFILVGTVPSIAVVPFYSSITKLGTNLIFVAIALAASGAIILLSDIIPGGRKKADNVTIADSVFVGAAQAVSTLPGLSRVGATVAMGASLRMNKEFALKFSMLLAIPEAVVSVLISLVSALTAGIDFSSAFNYVIGAVVAAIAGYFALTVVRNIIQRVRFTYLAYYCFGLGALTLILSLIF